MRRDCHVVVQQVCPVSRSKEGGYVLRLMVRHEGVRAVLSLGYRTKAHARWAQHFLCSVKNDRRLSAMRSLLSMLKKGGNAK